MKEVVKMKLELLKHLSSPLKKMITLRWKLQTEDEEENDEQVFCVDRIGSSQDELLANAGNSSSLSETDEFLSIPDEFKRKVKE